MAKILLSTPRLNLREITREDAPFLMKLMNTPDWLTNIGDRGINSLEAAIVFVETRCLPAYEKNLASYLIEIKDGSIPIGTCGIHTRDYLDIPDVGYSLLPEYYKQGYAYEASEAIIRYAKTNWGLSRISGMVIPSNTPSIRLLEKLGLKYVSPIEVPNDPEVVHLYVGDAEPTPTRS